MLNFTTVDNKQVSINPQHVSLVVECGHLQIVGSLLSGSNAVIPAAEIQLSNGSKLKVLDPNRTVARMIQEAK